MDTAEPLTSLTMSAMALSKVFKDNTGKITSLDFDSSGEYLLTSSEDESVRIYDVKQGKPTKTVYSKKYGCSLAMFTHRHTTLLHSSTKEDDTIRYLSLHDNKYIRYFKGHKNRVVSMEMCPSDDGFISGAVNDSVRLWDLRSANCHGCVNIVGNPVVAYDQSGSVFAVSLDWKRGIYLYDAKQYENGPFITFHVFDENLGNVIPEIVGLEFSNNGDLLLVSTNVNAIYVLDSFEGKLKFKLTGHSNPDRLPLKAIFTPDCQFVMCGSSTGGIHVWCANTGRDVGCLDGHIDVPELIKFNPKYLMFASVDSSLGFWTPPPQ
ncbi:WD40-repeat-containing domain protein [Polychytrium aggregatum]|uniref:WD40-repeat-containing domain protein n=1 Tax=Polychytrium aggregatum TaxID=110093 RepID=UPI0022FE8E83|nr:WD40-repeat-containing domain protein [Polychytrium aggregatum]KAI9197436.1 WD40-repeat-containing domain protein [Polychytrium aggregatum]